jgi:hypothetical protein
MTVLRTTSNLFKSALPEFASDFCPIMFSDSRRVFGVEVLVCTGAFASIVLLKYLLVRTEKRPNPNENVHGINSQPVAENSFLSRMRPNRPTNDAVSRELSGNSTTKFEELVNDSAAGDRRQAGKEFFTTK